jgi:SAM-dependent methyltransferase
VSLIDLILRQPLAYRLWMAPFAAAKLQPVVRHNDLRAVKRVLDVGCGPGTNAPWFQHADYVGVDLNEQYVANARKRYGRTFVAADVRGNDFPVGSGFDCILVNSLLHHLDTPSSRSLLERLAQLLTPDGHIHMLELVMPEGLSVARALAHADRGDFPRPLAEWKTLFNEIFAQDLLEPYQLTGGPVTLWQMVYFKGRLKTSS